MSVPVEIRDLGSKVDEYGPVAFLVTVGAEGAPHLVSAQVTLAGEVIVAECGTTTRANAERSATVSVLWPARPGGEYCLIVDGSAHVDGDTIAVSPVRAVLHRVADAPAELPSCVTVLDRR